MRGAGPDAGPVYGMRGAGCPAGRGTGIVGEIAVLGIGEAGEEALLKFFAGGKKVQAGKERRFLTNKSCCVAYLILR